MKTTALTILTSISRTQRAQMRGDAIDLSREPQPPNIMRKLIALVLLVLLGAAAPLLQAQTTESFTFTTNRVVPDGDASGLADVRNISSTIGTITSVKVRLKVAGEFNGDLYGYLRHTNGITVLLNRPGKNAAGALGYDDSGFDVTFQTGASNGDIHTYQNVMTPSTGSPLTGIWEPDGRDEDPDSVTNATPRNTSLTNFNNLAASGEWTLYLADMESGGTNMLTEWSLDITGIAYPTLTWTNPANIVYGTALSATQLNASAIYDSTNVPGTFTYIIPSGTVLNAGSGQTLSVIFTPTDTNTFLAVNTSVTINVDTAPLTITAVSTNKIYGAALPTFIASYSGFVNGDDASVLDTPVSLTTTATSSSAAGTYTITASGAADANYSITHVNGTLTIGAATLTITADDKTKAYGQALPVLTASYSGFVNGDDTNSLTALAALATTATTVSNVGTYPITASGASSTNYSFNYVAGTLTVTNSLSTGALVSSANPALPGADVTFTMTVSAVAPGAGTPTGTVNFKVDGSVLGSGTLSGGEATFTTNNLAHGSHTIIAEYAGDTNFGGATNTLAQSQVINTPPVAGGDTIERYPTGTVKVRLATLLANDSDADSDSLGITVSTTSTNGGTVTTSGAWVFYTPTAGFTNADSFTYTITDGHGGSTVGTVTVAIKVDDAPGANLFITDLGGGSFRIVGYGIPGRTYRLQSTDSLSPTNWQFVSGGSVTASSTGYFEYTDTPGAGSRYYRTVYP